MMTMRFDGKTVLVTGAAGNLGTAVGSAFHDAGANVALIDLDAQVLSKAWGGEAARRLLVEANLLDEASVAAAANIVRKNFGAIDVLCNIAGGFASGPPVHEMPAA